MADDTARPQPHLLTSVHMPGHSPPSQPYAPSHNLIPCSIRNHHPVEMPVPLSEADTRAKLIDPALHQRGWTEDLIKREETAGAIEIIDGRARRRGRGRTDYTLRVKVNPDTQPVVVAVLEAKAEHLPPTAGLEQAKW